MDNIESKKITRMSLVDAIVEKMLNLIIKGQFDIGERIPSEKVLAQEFGVSRSTLREAFKKLENLGVISIRQGDGTYLIQEVIDRLLESEGRKSNSYVHEVLQNMFEIDDFKLSHYLEARQTLETSSFISAIERVQPDDLAKLHKVIEKQAEVETDISKFPKIDLEFHTLLIAASHNKFYQQFWDFLTPYHEMQVMRVYTTPGMAVNACNLHAAMYDALVQKNVKAGKKLIEEHLNSIPGRLLTQASKQVRSRIDKEKQ